MQDVSEQSERENGNGGGPYRVGRHQGRNLYRDEEYLGVMFDPADTAAIVARLNRNVTSGASEWPEVFVDGDGDAWRRGKDGRYRLPNTTLGASLSLVMSRYGVSTEGGPYTVGAGDPRDLYRDEVRIGVLFDGVNTGKIVYVMNLPKPAASE